MPPPMSSNNLQLVMNGNIINSGALLWLFQNRPVGKFGKLNNKCFFFKLQSVDSIYVKKCFR